MPSFDKYINYIRQYHHFFVEFSEDWLTKEISQKDIEWAMLEWLAPLLGVSEKVYLYKRWPDSCLPPMEYIPLSKTKNRIELDHSKMPINEYHNLWSWALSKNSNIVLCVASNAFPTHRLAVKSWDPAILCNLRATLAASSVAFAKKQALKGFVCCIFGQIGNTITATLFAAPEKLIEMYTEFVTNCQFKNKYNEADFEFIRKKKIQGNYY